MNTGTNFNAITARRMAAANCQQQQRQQYDDRVLVLEQKE
jgi:hypothetical protein